MLCLAVIWALLTNRLVINEAIGEECLVTKTLRRGATSVNVIDECPAGGIVPHTRVKTMLQEEGSVVETAWMQACICHCQLACVHTHNTKQRENAKTPTGACTTAKRKR